MDTSETYIKMCEKAEPDLIFQTPRLLEDTHNYWASRGFGIPSLHPVWLPTQSQLQEMLEGKFTGWTYAGVLNAIQAFCYSFTNYNSWEQLWLAFVMKEKYNKVWDGEKWIKEE